MSVILPKHLTTIEAEAFSGCSALEGELVVPSCLESIGRAAFAGCYGIDKAIMTEPLDEPDEGGDIS